MHKQATPPPCPHTHFKLWVEDTAAVNVVQSLFACFSILLLLLLCSRYRQQWTALQRRTIVQRWEERGDRWYRVWLIPHNRDASCTDIVSVWYFITLTHHVLTGGKVAGWEPASSDHSGLDIVDWTIFTLGNFCSFHFCHLTKWQ